MKRLSVTRGNADAGTAPKSRLRYAHLSWALLAVGALLLPGRWLAADSKTEVSLASRVEMLTRVISELHQRIAALEAAAETAPFQAGQKIVAPFEVVDETGKSLLLVTNQRIQAVGATRLTGSLQVASPSGKLIADLGDRDRRIAAPFEVGAGAGTPVLVVSDKPILSTTRGSRVQIEPGSVGNVILKVLGANGHLAAGMGETKEGVGSFEVYDANGKLRADVYGKNGLNVYGSGAKPVITLAPDPERGNAGSVNIWGPAGKVLATMNASAQGGSAGAVSVMNASGTPVAGLTSSQGGGAVVVTNSGGVGLAEMSVSSDGRGLFQVFGRGGRPVAVLTQAKESPGGLLQISNTGTPVANITVGLHGGGYFQLTNASGLPTIEAGTRQDGRGQVRAGPLYKCSPVQIATTGMQAGFTDCLMGAVK